MDIQDKTIWPKKTLLAPVFSTFVCLILMIVSVFHPQWSTLSQNENSLQFSLFNCQNCQAMYKEWSWQCFSNICDSKDIIGDCQIYSNNNRSAYAYFSLEVFSFIIGLVLLEKLILLMSDKRQGKNLTLYLLSFSMMIGHIIAISAWYQLNPVDFISYGAEENPIEISFEAKNGPQIAKINCLLCFLSFLLLAVILHRQPDRKWLENSISLESLAKRYKFNRWMGSVGWLFVLGIIAIFSALIVNRWVLRISVDSYWEGGLSNCIDCEEEFTDMNWGCLATFYCFQDSTTGTCQIYKHLYDAYKSYAVLECFALLCSIFFLQTYFHIAAKKDYGIPFMNYIWAISVAMFNLIATVIWFSLSNSKLTFNCRGTVKVHEEPTMCSTFGPYTILSSNVFFIAMAVIFCIAYSKRNDDIRQVIIDQNDSKIVESAEVKNEDSKIV